MATHSSILAWRILWTEEPGGLQPIGLQRARHDWNSWAWGLRVVTTRASQWAENISLGRGSLFKTTWENWLLNFTPGESQGTLVCKGSEKAYACVCVCFSHVQLFVTSWAVAHQVPLSIEFSRREYWTRLPFPTAGAFPNSGTEPMSLASPALAEGYFFFFTTSSTWEALHQNSVSEIWFGTRVQRPHFSISPNGK